MTTTITKRERFVLKSSYRHRWPSNGVKLNFDKFAIKMINELKKINNENGTTKDDEVKCLETLVQPK